MLSQSVGYAITALGCIASAGGKPVLVKEIAEAANIPPSYLAKIIHSLARRGLVNTQRGVGGGVTLARPAVEISLYDVCVALDDSAVQPICMLGNATCSDERACPAHKHWQVQRARNIDFLSSTTVADVAAFEARRQWKLPTRRLCRDPTASCDDARQHRRGHPEVPRDLQGRRSRGTHPRSASAGLRDRPRHPEHHAGEPRQVREDRGIRASTGSTSTPRAPASATR
jgi:Rrf2 family iron-sulfur cluster assembly transcriptional regulator